MKHALGDEVVALSLYGGAFALAGLVIDRSALRSMYWSSASRLEKTLVWGASLGLCVSSVNVAMRHPLLEFELFDSRLRPKDLVTGAVAIVPFAREGATECEWSWLGLFCAAFVTFRFASAIASRSMRDGVLRPSVVAFLSLGAVGVALSSLLRESLRFLTGVLVLTQVLATLLECWVLAPSPEAVEALSALALPCAALLTTVFGLRALSGAPGASNSDLTPSHGSEGLHLQFCEAPYAFSHYAAQGCSLAMHLPVVPGLAVALPSFRARLCGRPVPRIPPDARPCLGLLLAFQSWTCYGHYLPDPRTRRVAEISILLAHSWLLYTFKATTPFLQRHRAVFRVAFAAFSAFGAFAFTCFGLVPLILSNATILVAGYKYRDDLGALIPPRTRAVIAALLLVAVLLIVLEATFCAVLTAFAPLPYHAIFDFLFFQVLASYVTRATLLAAPSTRNKGD